MASPSPAECLNPCPEQGETSRPPGRWGCSSTTKLAAGVTVYRHLAARTQSAEIAGSRAPIDESYADRDSDASTSMDAASALVVTSSCSVATLIVCSPSTSGNP